MKNKLSQKILLASLAVALLPFIAASCGYSTADPLNGRHPRLLLNGTAVDSDEDDPFEYYCLDQVNHTYAVSLKDKSYTGEQGTIDIPSEYILNETKIGDVVGIYNNAFFNCPATTVVIPSSVHTIDYEAFLYSGIESITIPYSVKQLGDGAFYGSKVETVFFESNSQAASTSAVSCACDTPSGSGQTPIPSELETIPAYCFFKCSELTTLTLPGALTEIRYGAFEGCKKLTSNLYFESIEAIHERAFQGCIGLTHVYLPQRFFEDEGVIEEHAFNFCSPSLTFHFCGWSSTNANNPVDTWLSKPNNSTWGWFNDTEDPSAVSNDLYVNQYNPAKIEGDLHYVDDWVYTTTPVRRSIYVVGDFTNWKVLPEYRLALPNDPGEGEENLWSITKTLDAGTYNYRFVIANTNDQDNPDSTTLNLNPRTLTIENDNTDHTFSITHEVIDNNDATIIEYRGTTENVDYIRVPDLMPSKVTTYVRRINADVLNGLKTSLERLYLPTTLYAIENRMFEGFSKLFVIDDNVDADEDGTGSCSVDRTKKTGSQEVKGRIDLHRLNDLEFIGTRAFPYMGDSTIRRKIKLIHLPARLRAIGPEAFSLYDKSTRFTNVDKLLWDYDDTSSRLEIVGNNAFFNMGNEDISSDRNVFKPQILRNTIVSTTIAFPRTFKGFGLKPAYLESYSNGKSIFNPSQNCNTAFTFEALTAEAQHGDGHSGARPGHIFAGSPLIKNVIFKGSMNAQETTDLIIPLQTFVSNDNLQNIFFEERKDHEIVFHSQQGRHGQQTIGSSTGLNGEVLNGVDNDFRPEPMLQTIVLPNRETNLVIQEFAFRGNSRAAIYLTGKLNQSYTDNGQTISRIRGDKNSYSFYTDSYSYCDISQIKYWKMIGDEAYVSNPNNTSKGAYYGYCFNPDVYDDQGKLVTRGAITEATDYINSFGLCQEIPVHENVYYSDEIDGVPITVGAETYEDENQQTKKSNVLKFIGKFAFICKEEATDAIDGVSFAGTAEMTKYLYSVKESDLKPSEYNGNDVIAHVPATVSVGNDVYKVSAIGDSAFSAAFCDGKWVSGSPNVGTFKDLAIVELPNTITKIGEYAFMRAYGVRKVSSYAYNYLTKVASLAQDYTMSSSLDYIGKHGFAFCGVEQVLNIPNGCKFYENSEENYKVSSVFANDFALQRISFDNPTDPNSSQYYKATTYSDTVASLPFEISNNQVPSGKSVYLSGTFNDWNISEDYKMTLSGDKWTGTFSIKVGSYDYKYVIADPEHLESADWNTLNNDNRILDIIVNSPNVPYQITRGETTISLNSDGLQIILVYDPPNNYSPYLTGNFDGYNWSLNGKKMTKGTPNNSTWRNSNRIPINAGDYEYKFVRAHYSNPNTDPDWTVLNENNRRLVVLDADDATGIRTSALYSTGSAPYNSNRLLLVLNRDSSHSSSLAQDTSAIINDGFVAGGRFNGQYMPNGTEADPALFGAYKMGYWIYDLSAGQSTVEKVDENNTNRIPQALFSGMVLRPYNDGQSNHEWWPSYIYLNKSSYDFSDTECDLVIIEGNLVGMADQALRGCEKLEYVLLAYELNGSLPAGILASIDNEDLTFATPGESSGSIIAEQGLLDLTNSGYYSIGDSALKGIVAIERFIATKRKDFIVGASAFEGCSNLTTADFSNVGGDGADGSKLEIGAKAFKNTSVTSFVAPAVKGELKLGDEAFMGCVGLEEIDLSKFVGSKITIGNDCFNGCTSLKTIKWPNKNDVEIVIGNQAFINCTSFLGNYNDNPEDPYVLVFPSKTTKIGPNEKGGGSFQNCDSLTSVVLPSQLNYMGDWAFNDCDNLESVSVGSVNSSLPQLNRYVFANCPKLDNFDFNSFTKSNFKIWQHAFENSGKICENGDVTLPSNYIAVGKMTFTGSKIVSITIEAPSFQIEGANRNTEYGGFYNADYLREVTFKCNTLRLDFGSFQNCDSLEGVYFENPNCNFTNPNNNIFDNCPVLRELCLPTGFPATDASNYPNFIRGDNDVKVFLHVSSANVSTPEWKKINNLPTYANHYFKVTQYSNFFVNGDTSGNYRNDPFWMEVNGRPVLLGNIVRGDSASVTFDTGITLFSDFTTQKTFVVHHGINPDPWTNSPTMVATPDGNNKCVYEATIHLNKGEGFGIRYAEDTNVWYSFNNIDSSCQYLFTQSGNDAIAKRAGTYSFYFTYDYAQNSQTIAVDVVYDNAITVTADLSLFDSWGVDNGTYFLHVWKSSDSSNPYAPWGNRESLFIRQGGNDSHTYSISIAGEATFDRAALYFWQNTIEKKTSDLIVSLAPNGTYTLTVASQDQLHWTGDVLDSGVTIS